MACMTHTCATCHYETFNNERDGGTCPKCNGTHWLSTFDEPDNDNWPYDDEEWDCFDELEKCDNFGVRPIDEEF